MSKVIDFPGLQYGDTTPETVLEQAKNWGMDRCIIIGFTDDALFKFGGSFSDLGEILILLEFAKKFVIENEFAREA